MFYDLQLLSRKNGKFALLWCVATCRSSLRISKVEYLSINIEGKGEEIMMYLGSSSGNPKQRFSLYLSAQLTYGLTYIYYRQLEYLLSDALLTYQLSAQLPKNGKVPRLKPKKPVRRLTDLSQAEIDAVVQQNMDRIMQGLPEINPKLLSAPSENVVQDKTSIQIQDDAPPPFNEPQLEDDFGVTTPGIFDIEIPRPGPAAAISNIVEDEFRQQTVVVMIHPVPPEYANTEVPSVDPIALNTHGIQPSAEKRNRNVNLDEIIQLPAEITDTRNKDLDQITTVEPFGETIAEIDVLNFGVGPNSKSTPLPTSRLQENVSAQVNTNELPLDSQIDIPVRNRGQKRKHGALLIDEETVIPTDIMKTKIKQKVELQFKTNEYKLFMRSLKFNNQDLFHVPAHNSIMSNKISKYFSWECAGRQHTNDILNEILGIRSADKNINPDTESSGQLSSISSIGTPHVSGRSNLHRSSIRNIIENRVLETDEAEVLQEPRPVLETITESSDIRESVNSKVSAQKVSKASDKLTKITEDALPIREPEVPHEQTILQDIVQEVMEPLPSLLTDTREISVPDIAVENVILHERRQEKSLEQSTEFIKTKRIQREEEINIRLNELWNSGLDKIPFLTLCPPNKTNKLKASYTFRYLLDLHKQKKVVLISLENSITIGYIRKYGNN